MRRLTSVGASEPVTVAVVEVSHTGAAARRQARTGRGLQVYAEAYLLQS